ncbi:hypothetical protein [Bdellovibrio sp. HCB337]|uniref:hypothetical protein n=1 Tax=Bdellovibrio sp. HCB337 TaxID=3394358 RepID=UPI0039A5DBF2
MKKYMMNLAVLVLSTQALAGVGDVDSSKLLAKNMKSVYTDLSKDCIEISSATDKAPIDFYEADCKSFGGYRLKIEGGDLRYHPSLSFGNKEIEIAIPMSFHDTGSTKIEWVYQLEQNEEGLGKLVWKGLIFRLNHATPDGESDISNLYAVRLDGDKSCLIGTTQDNIKARDLVYNSKPGCK